MMIHPIYTVGVPNLAFQHEDNDYLPVRKRQCNDITFLFIFILFFSFLVSKLIYINETKRFFPLCHLQGYILVDVIFIKHSNPNLIIHGYDHYGNICGENNSQVLNLTQSGQNMIDKPFLLVRNSKSDLIERFCVEKCPEHGYQ